ncbi:hypothetical protein H4219_005490 [Mycoemilia scoparia]|uniref:Gamma-glutamyltransferase n=1 Tax=Mycoemilia scoparia TaxID=417184 RepID=A0A9W8DJR6_9FUNG|nr:hypothetical protein H4219_005490 [Mycoemilia scoparia]
MDDFSTHNQANHFGLRPSPNNKILPGKRPLSSTVPTIVENENGGVELVVGGSGGSRITTGVLQIILNSLVYDFPLNNAVDHGRLHHQLMPDYVEVESGYGNGIKKVMSEFGHKVEDMPVMECVVQAIRKVAKDTIFAVSDVRKGGVAAGY